ncbi:hypothetical protein [Algisphaera agarilytica]|uniref:Lipoprotein n=1 Tax=Algisphaera agarilytica TaxID=1385975 RepID=A0A7X0H7S3_9BACT|nr:hypothetical protein [Algisphaera agarilytica]MBB6430838.1 hypothetical protein [Algisphaera agarilytica]
MPLKLLPMLLVAMLATGCSVYTNIPPENGDWASNNPNTKPVIEVSVASIQKTLENEPFNSPYYVALPPRTTPETYAIVVNALGDDAIIPTNVPVVELDEKGKPIKSETELEVINEPAVIGEFPSVEVRAVYIRGADAKVDVVRPSNSGRRLSTVDLVWEAGFGWSAVSIRAWRVDPDNLPQPALPPSKQPLKSETAAE